MNPKNYKSTMSGRMPLTEKEIYFPSTPKSQKGKGIINAWQALGKDAMPPVALITTDESPKNAAKIAAAFFRRIGGKDCFVRPCPESPNHGGKVGGFESAKFSTLAEIIQRVNDAQNAFRTQKLNADLVLMPFVQSRISCVIAPKMYAIFGRGHDGVTAGTSETVIVPLAAEDNFVDKVSAFTSMTENNYELEFVVSGEKEYGWEYDTLKAHFVQVRRSGNHKIVSAKPTADSLPGFAPFGGMIVEKVYVVKDLDNVGELENMNNEPGLLVIQPGGSMLSHAAAHCRTKSIAFVISKDDNWVGRKITEIASGWITDDPNAFYSGAMSLNDYKDDFLKGFNEPFHKWNVKLSVFFHDFLGQNANAEKGAYLAGRYAKWLAQAATVLCVGESRHTQQMHEDGKITHAVNSAIRQITGGAKMSPSRDYIYEKLFDWNMSSEEMRKILTAAAHVFGEFAWSSSFGGSRWENCARNALAIVQAVEAGNIVEACKYANLLENSVHNGGRLFNKVHGWLSSMDAGTKLMDIPSGMLATDMDDRNILHSAHFALYPQYCTGSFTGDIAEYEALTNLLHTSSSNKTNASTTKTNFVDSTIIFKSEDNK
jgi:hypothetical protein